MERRVRVSETDWTIARPPRLLDGGGRRGYRVAVGSAPAGAWAMQRADLAAVLLDATEKHQYSRAIVGVTSA
jgi:putative NADH-flavin reductase